MGGIKSAIKTTTNIGKKTVGAPIQAVVAPKAFVRNVQSGIKGLRASYVPIRDAAESAAVLAGNYFLPGSSLVTSRLVSEGSKKQLGSKYGRLAQLGTGGAGAWQGNLANYGSLMGGAGAEQGMANLAEGAPILSETAPSVVAPEIGTAAISSPIAAPITEAAVMPTYNPATNTPLTFSGAWDAAKSAGNYYLPSAGTAVNTLSLGTNLYGLMMAKQMADMSQQAGEQADPFGPQRAEYAAKMAELEKDPTLLTKDPGYKAGLEAIQRSMAAQGYAGSGNMMAALAKYGGDFYQNAMQRYANLAGAQFSPAQAAQTSLMGQQSAMNLGLNAMQGLTNTARLWNSPYQAWGA